MTTRGRALRFTAISALVVLGLTGFSTGRHGHGHGHGGDGGGGCSSSGQDHDSSSSTSGGGAYKDDDTYGSSSGGGYHDHDDDTYDGDTTGSGSTGGTGGTGREAATAELVTCATESDPYATVEVTNPNGTEHTFAVTVLFKDAADATIADGREETTVPARGVAEVRVPLDGSTTPDHCALDEAEPLPLS
ncbi:hypothetical protein [Streptomyces sp. NPDC048392]|uniref:hypothetical protein n=1 Tax=Streptomyces sp. NPDC048392 TaxID=3365543 RepID=UPI00371AA8D9